MLIRRRRAKVKPRRTMILQPPSRYLTLHESYSQRSWKGQRRIQARARILAIL
jgi:hypothetical protein